VLVQRGSVPNTGVMGDSVLVTCVMQDAADIAFQIHCLERSAYAAVLRAFCAQSDLLSRVLTSSYSLSSLVKYH
jgi:hypothetical protein